MLLWVKAWRSIRNAQYRVKWVLEAYQHSLVQVVNVCACLLAQRCLSESLYGSLCSPPSPNTVSSCVCPCPGPLRAFSAHGRVTCSHVRTWRQRHTHLCPYHSCHAKSRIAAAIWWESSLAAGLIHSSLYSFCLLKEVNSSLVFFRAYAACYRTTES